MKPKPTPMTEREFLFMQKTFNTIASYQDGKESFAAFVEFALVPRRLMTILVDTQNSLIAALAAGFYDGQAEEVLSDLAEHITHEVGHAIADKCTRTPASKKKRKTSKNGKDAKVIPLFPQRQEKHDSSC